MTEATWHKTACILCKNNCGIQIQRDDRRFAKIRGDKDHVATGGYTCNKALRLDRYRNGPPGAHAFQAHVRGTGGDQQEHHRHGTPPAL